MAHSRLVATSLSLALLASALPARADTADDRFTLRLGRMHAEGSGALYGAANGPDNGVSFDKDFDLGDRELAPRVDGVFRISQRNRLVFDYFRFEKDARAGLGEEVTIGDEVVPAGSFAEAEARFQLASLIYDFSVVDSARFSAGLQIGAEYARLDGKVRAASGDDSFRASGRVDGYAPVVGVRLTATPADRWLLSAQAQYLDAGWGNFDFDGSIERANALVEYRFTELFGVFVGYDYFKIDYQETGSDASGSVDLKFRGPVAGLTLSF